VVLEAVTQEIAAAPAEPVQVAQPPKKARVDGYSRCSSGNFS